MPDGTRFENKYEEDTNNTTQLITRLENKYEEDIHNTMQLIYSDESEDDRKSVTIDWTPYKGKIAVAITSEGGLYIISFLKFLHANTIKDDTHKTYVGTSNSSKLVIAFQGMINIFAIK